MMERTQDYALRREMAAVELGHKCVRNDDGTYTVWSDTVPHLRYTTEVRYAGADMVRIKCDCKSGKKRGLLFIPCWHAAKTIRRLEREKLVEWRYGHWFLTAKGFEFFDFSNRVLANPPAGLPRS